MLNKRTVPQPADVQVSRTCSHKFLVLHFVDDLCRAAQAPHFEPYHPRQPTDQGGATRSIMQQSVRSGSDVRCCTPYLIGDSQVFDGIAANIGLRHAPEFVSILQRGC